MPSDVTRTSDDLRQRYKAVVIQQGRVTLDRDFNALQEIVNGQIAADALDVIGPCATPDDGFAISLPETGPSASFSSSGSAPAPWDFLIAPGTMYVGGQRVVLPTPSPDQALWSYFHQPDWINPPRPAALIGASQSTPVSEYVYLHVYEQEVGGVEDPDLLDVALGGPDTTQRVRLMWRVVRMPVAATDCTTALTLAQNQWASRGFLSDTSTMRIWPQAALQVSFTATAATSTPCDPIVQGGYLGAENQLIRLQISGPASAGGPQLLWGYDDASFIYGVSREPGGQTLALNQVPVDAFHCPTTNQVVEVLRSAAILGFEPDATDPTGSATIVRCVAEPAGFVTTVASYSNTNNTVLLNSELPAPYLSDSNPLFLRIWQGQQSINLSSQPMTLTDPTTQASLGINITLTVPSGSAPGAALPAGAFWMIAVRPSTPQAVYPERFLTGPQPPDGPRQWICPLAVIDWTGGASASIPPFSSPSATIADCRNHFCNLTKLSNPPAVPPPISVTPPGGPCTITVRPIDTGHLQQILNDAGATRQTVRICLMPGTYPLPEPLRLTRDHSDFVLEAPQGGVRIQADVRAAHGPFRDGLIILVGADRVRLRRLTFVPPRVAFTPTSRLGAQFHAHSHARPEFIAMIGLRPVDCRGLTVEDCTIEFPRLSFSSDDVVFAVGLFAAGDCTGLEVHGCRFESETFPKLTHIETRTDNNSIERANPRRSAGPFVAVFGVLATTPFRREFRHHGARTDRLLRTALDDASIRDNRFNNLTIAVFGHALDLGKVRIQDNIVTDCSCGFWLITANLPSSSERSLKEHIAATMIDQASKFWEIQDGSVISREYPLPHVLDKTQHHPALAEQEDSALQDFAEPNPARVWAFPILHEIWSDLKPLDQDDATKSIKAPALLIINNDIQALPRDPTMTGDEFDIRWMSSLHDVRDLPTAAKSLIVVAKVDHLLHFRIFDGDGNRVVDTDERRLTGKAPQIQLLRERLEGMRTLHELSTSEKAVLIAGVTVIVGHNLGASARSIVGHALGSVALLAVVGGKTERIRSGSLIVNSNNVRGRTSTWGELRIPVALLVLDCPTAITGNIIIDENPVHEHRYSLWVFPHGDDASELAVTGNVLVGESDLDALTRSDLGRNELTTWITLNSTRR